MKPTPRSGDQGTKMRGQRSRCHEVTGDLNVFCCIELYFRFYLDFLLYVVEDESLRVDEVVRGVERDGVQRAAVNAASIQWPATRF